MATHDLLLMMRRSLESQVGTFYESQRESIFQTRCSIKGNLCAMIIDSGSCTNLASVRLVSKLNLGTKPHPKPYKLQWLSEEVEVVQQVQIHFVIGKYVDHVLCDVVPMEACHLLLGRPWQFDKRATHEGFNNKFSFLHQNKRYVLKPLSPQEAFEDQKKLREKIEKERKEKQEEIEKEEKIMREKEIEKENEREKNCLENVNSNIVSSPFDGLISHELKKESLKEAPYESPCSKRKYVDIIPSAPLYIQPTFIIPSLASFDKNAKDCVVENTITSQKLFVDDLFLCKKKIFDALFAVKSYGLKQIWSLNPFKEYTCFRREKEASSMLMERTKFEFQRMVFDPGG